MKRAGRVADVALVPEDTHGHDCCAHAASGPAIQGSPNVLINQRAALRTDDAGRHATCCGPNRWRARGGARYVVINGRLAHRMTDETRHCGGAGHLATGSPDVLVGDAGLEGRPSKRVVVFSMKDPFGRPLVSAEARVTFESGGTRDVVLDGRGKGIILDAPAGRYFVKVKEARYAPRRSS